MPVQTRAQVRRLTRQAARRILGTAAAGTAGYVASGGPRRPTASRPRHAPRGNRRSKVRAIAGPRSSFRHKKKRVINSKLSGVTKKFVTKVQKAVAYTGVWGIYKYIAGQQLRQINLDRMDVLTTDENSQGIELDTPLSAIDGLSVLWNNKTAKNDFATQTGNVPQTVPFTQMWSRIDFFFKSTSSHVVNVEMLECTYKKNSDKSAQNLMSASINDFNFKTAVNDGAGADTSDVLNGLGVGIEGFTTLFNYCHVKKHVVKLQPGGYSSISVKGQTNKIWDYAKFQKDVEGVPLYVKGSKSFVFRTVNDCTISGNTVSNGQVHHWPSNQQGGVAMEYTRTIKYLPPKPGLIDDDAFIVNSYLIGNYLQTTTTNNSDQQVTQQFGGGSTDITP